MKYVFVVCGTDEHIDTLHFSLAYLRHFSDKEIWVITDLSRNNKSIEHDKVIDVVTPKHYNHHQASVYLKTSLHRYLPPQETNAIWCYLDTDVVAIRAGVDEIFEQYNSPITFCSDHCRLAQFSPTAVPMPLNADLIAQRERLEQLMNDYEQHQAVNNSNPKSQNAISFSRFLLKKHFKLQALALSNPKNWIKKTAFYLSKISGALLKGFYRLDEQGIWRLKKNNTLVFDLKDKYELCLRGQGFFYNRHNQNWYNSKGDALIELMSNRLQSAVLNKFGVNIKDNNWQHWNGGVFLFNQDSHTFLDNWHDWTMQIFEDKQWRTRDQGTLAATVWRFGLENQVLLPLSFNFLADYYKQDLVYKGNLSFELQQKLYEPKFLHIYHHWGDTNWAVWTDVEKLQRSEYFGKQN